MKRFKEALKKIKKRYIALILIIFGVYLIADIGVTALTMPETVPYSEFEKELNKGNVDIIYYAVDSESMRYCLFNDTTKDMSYKDRQEYEYPADEMRMTHYPAYEEFRVDCLRHGCRMVVKDFSPLSVKIVTVLSSLALPILFIWIMYTLVMQMRRFDKEPTNAVETSNVSFANVVGHDEILEDVKFIVEMMKNPKLGEKTGAKLPKGILFSGPPGTGKTLIAKAIAGEANVPFLYMNASSFIEMYVGLGAKRVRALFESARKQAPCIVFIDEIDAVGGSRAKGIGGDSEHNQTLNALLQEMDGFEARDGVFIIAATNTPDFLDKALKRAGRFDREIVVGPPKDWHVRKDLFEYFMKDKKLDESVNIETLSRQTVGFTGADIEAVVNESSIIAAMDDQELLTMKVIEEAIDKQIFKGNKSKDKHQDHDKEIVAYHEAGHAVTGYLLGIKIARASIAGTTTGVGGAVFQQESNHKLMSKSELLKQVKVCYGGRASEEIKFEDVTIGARDDISKATQMLTNYVEDYGFDDDIGLLAMDQLKKIDTKIVTRRIQKLSHQCYTETKELLRANYDMVELLADNLLRLETLSAEGIYEILDECERKEVQKYDEETQDDGDTISDSVDIVDDSGANDTNHRSEVTSAN